MNSSGNAYPYIDLILLVSIPLLDVKAEDSALEVRYGAGSYTDIDHRLLLEETVTPVCSPTYYNEMGPFQEFRTESEVLHSHLIRNPLEPWAPWFKACGIDSKEPVLGGQFNDIGLIYAAAASGFGVALLRHRMESAWLESGRLLRLSPHSVASPYRHYLCWQPGALDRWECAAFADWLQASLPPA